MELLASGFNAWGQLNFTDPDPLMHKDTQDFLEFTCVLRGISIAQVQAHLSYTTSYIPGVAVIYDGVKRTAGHRPKRDGALHEQYPGPLLTLAHAANGSSLIDQAGNIIQLNSLYDSIGAGESHGQCISELPSCTQVVAYATGFAALTTTGDVYTWGDERYVACLGREVSAASPADKPGLVTALQDLPTGPISKIAAGGYILAALTSGYDLYLWGGHPGRNTVPADISDEPTPVVIEEHDIADVAVGDAHLIVLTTEGRIYVIGDNGNGQLGLPLESTDSWRPVELSLQEKRAVSVAAGPRNSFIVIQEG